MKGLVYYAVSSLKNVKSFCLELQPFEMHVKLHFGTYLQASHQGFEIKFEDNLKMKLFKISSRYPLTIAGYYLLLF